MTPYTILKRALAPVGWVLYAFGAAIGYLWGWLWAGMQDGLLDAYRESE